MGKYSGKVLTIYISPHGVRVCEGENKNGDPDISKYFVVHGVESYFTSEVAGTTPEITNMSGLVNAILDECKQRHTLAKRVMVCSDCFGIETTVEFSTGLSSKSIMNGDIKSIFSGLKSDASESSGEKMVTKVKWGQTASDGKIQNVATQSIGDKYMLKSLVTEFFRHGYEVIYVSGAAEVLTNLWQTEPASFDSQGKIILDVDVGVRVVTFVKDVPVEFNRLSILSGSEMLDRIKTIVKQGRSRTGRNPLIYLAGTMFGNVNFYKEVSQSLEEEGLRVYDLLGCSEISDDYETQVENGEVEPLLTADYVVNIAMLMCGFTKQLIGLTPHVETSEVLQKNSKAIAVLALVASVGVFGASLGLTGLHGYKLFQMSQNPSELSGLQGQVMALQTRQNSLNSTIETLTQADTTVLELMKFIKTNQSDRVHVVSMDTRDMLTNDLNVEVNGAPPTGVTVDGTPVEDTTVSGTSGEGGSTRESIVVRGYAKTGNEAVGFYNRLFNYGLPVDPVLNGVERYTLPNSEEVYIFEIEIGGDQF